MDHHQIEIGRDRNENGEPLVRVGGVICGTVETWKGMIAQYELCQPAKVFDANCPSFRSAVLDVVRTAGKQRAL
jgi:hypothetical protein